MKQLYREPHPDAGQVVSRITSALDADTRREMAGGGVACCLKSLLQAAREAAEGTLATTLAAAGGQPPLLAASELVRERAERDIARRGHASRYSDIALNALAVAVFEAGGGGAADLFHTDVPRVTAELGRYVQDQHLHRLALTFVGFDFDHLYRYFVTRDTSDFVGGPGLPTVAEASQLRDAVSRLCRESVAGLEASVHETALAAMLQAEDEGALARGQAVLSDLQEQGLRKLAAGG